MRTRFILSILLFLTGGILNAAYKETSIINFGGGLNVKTIATDIEDTESPDMSNVINDLYGASFRRNGSDFYISQSYSTNPITSLYRAYVSTLTETKRTIMSTRDVIAYSTNDVNPVWITVSSGYGHNQHYSFAEMNDRIYFTGDGLYNPVKEFNIVSASMTSVFSSNTYQNIRSKYILNGKGYMLYGNCLNLTNGTTYYKQRLYYSDFLEPSSVTANRFIDFQEGGEITGVETLFNRVHIFHNDAIAELDYNDLHPDPTVGDQIQETVIKGFGCIAPRTLVNAQDFYIFLARDGIRLWDGGRKARLNVSEESRILSVKIQPLIDSMISAGTYRNAVGVYYPKKQWYLFAYEDPDISPKGKNNSVLVYDLVTGNWYRFRNWNVETWAVLGRVGDNGDLLYGDSADGYVHFADLEIATDDSRYEFPLDTMDSTDAWKSNGTSFSRELSNVVEGTAALKMVISPVSASSMTLIKILNLGEWPDKKRVTKQDKISFKVYPDSVSSIQSLRIDLLVNDIKTQFDTNFTSVTISTSSFSKGNTAYSLVEVELSTFILRPDWINLETEVQPFADRLTYYGLRFVCTVAATAAITIDDVRIVGGTDKPLNSYRDTKRFNLGKLEQKEISELAKLVLTIDKSPEDEFNVFMAKDFGEFSLNKTIQREVKKELFVCGYNGGDNVTKLRSTDFKESISTIVANQTIMDAMTGVADKKYLYIGDREKNRIVKIDRSSMTTINISSFGSLGSNSTSFDLIHQIAVDENFLYLVDNGNNRIKKIKLSSNETVLNYGTLGLGATSFHVPTGIAVDENYVYVGDDGNSRIAKLTKSTFGYISEVLLDFNTIGETTLAVDAQYLYVAYNKINETSIDHIDVLMEKRNKFDLSLLSRERVLPKDSVAVSSYSLHGDIAIDGKYVYVSFTDDINLNGKFYIQKRLKSNLKLVSQYESRNRHWGLVGYGLNFHPSLEQIEIEPGIGAEYVQIRFSENEVDNSMKLHNMSFKLR